MDHTGASFMAETMLVLEDELSINEARRVAARIWKGPWNKIDACWQELGIEHTLLNLGLIRKCDEGYEEVW